MCSTRLHPLRRVHTRPLTRAVQHMSKMRISTIAGAVTIFAILALPAAADELEDSLQTCNSCHGQNGEPIAKIIPIIWGQQESYLVKQIHDFKSKDRENPIMTPLAEGIKQPDIRKAARISQPRPGRRNALPIPPRRRPTEWPSADLPSGEFPGRPAGAAAGRAKLRISRRGHECVCRRATEQQRRHDEIDEGAHSRPAPGDGALSVDLVIGRA